MSYPSDVLCIKLIMGSGCGSWDWVLSVKLHCCSRHLHDILPSKFVYEFVPGCWPGFRGSYWCHTLPVSPLIRGGHWGGLEHERTVFQPPILRDVMKVYREHTHCLPAGLSYCCNGEAQSIKSLSSSRLCHQEGNHCFLFRKCKLAPFLKINILKPMELEENIVERIYKNLCRLFTN